jgi:hypothetical protein
VNAVVHTFLIDGGSIAPPATIIQTSIGYKLTFVWRGGAVRQTVSLLHQEKVGIGEGIIGWGQYAMKLQNQSCWYPECWERECQYSIPARWQCWPWLPEAVALTFHVGASV